ncbi:hypothetical protein [Paenibacillus sp. HB172176]|uniref:hypothetical protein n=1 Tax=Paenibacillus sp. HB172176 TaxID=2493690 RepID=UPI00143BE70A|nr:hypothetical protein [Paenibacillus sp. HB172176]
MGKKNMGFADRALFILGLTLAGVIAFVLVAGVVVAMLNVYVTSSFRSKRTKKPEALIEHAKQENAQEE